MARVNAAQLILDRHSDRGGQRPRLRWPSRDRRRLRSGRPRASKLLEVERIAAAFAEQRVAGRRIQLGIHQRLRLGRAQRTQVESSAFAGPDRLLQKSRQGRGRVPNRERREQRTPEPAQEVRDHLTRRRISPMHVIEHDHDRPARGEALQHSSNGVVEAVAVSLAARGRRLIGKPGQRREYVSELLQGLRLQRPHNRRIERSEVVVERIDDRSERDILFEFGSPTDQYQPPSRLGALRQLREQARLPDAGLPDELNDPRLTIREPGECPIKLRQLAPSTNHRARSLCHVRRHLDRPPRAYRGCRDRSRPQRRLTEEACPAGDRRSAAMLAAIAHQAHHVSAVSAIERQQADLRRQERSRLRPARHLDRPVHPVAQSDLEERPQARKLVRVNLEIGVTMNSSRV